MWKPQDHKRLDPILQKILKSTTAKGIISWVPTIDILFKELEYSATEPITLPILRHSISSMRKENKTSFDDFIAIATKLKYELSKKDTKLIILPYLNFAPRRKFIVNGIIFEKIEKKKINSLVNIVTLEEQIRATNPRLNTKIKLTSELLITRIDANHIGEAWENATSSFSVLQGAFDLAFSGGSWKLQSNYYPQTRFLHPTWIIMQKNENEFDFGTFNVPNSPTKNSHLPKDRKRQFSNLLKIITEKASENSSKQLIYNCLRLYGQASEAVYRPNNFLSYWQIIESTSIAELYNGNTDLIKKRINLIHQELKIFDQNFERLYDSLAKKRNLFVHTGIDSTDYIDANIMALFAEKCIQWLLKHHKKLSSKEHINEYFKLQTANLKSRKSILDTIKYINLLQS
jgi:hypothetical protein